MYGLFTAINDYNAISPLRGCVNDAHHIASAFNKLTNLDASVLINKRATLPAVKDRLNIAETSAHNSYVWHYSGHGTRVADRTLDEVVDRMDEAICLYDVNPATYWEDGLMIDDMVNEFIPFDKKGLVLFDSCHSGSANRDIQDPIAPAQRYAPPPFDIFARELLANYGRKIELNNSMKESLSEVRNKPFVFIGACKDEQTAADYYYPECEECQSLSGNELKYLKKNLFYHGVLSSSVVDFFKKYQSDSYTYGNLFDHCSGYAKNRGFEQVPQICYSGGLVATDKIFT